MITHEDVMRVAIEVMHDAVEHEDEDYRDSADQWASKHGMDESVMPMVCNSIREAFTQAMMEAAAEGAGDEVEMDGIEGIALDNGLVFHAIEMTIISAFRWGFETAEQCIPRTVIPE